jgi:hypothetical protein
MIGENECRMRATGPRPGKKPKTVGRMPTLNWRRLPCWTHCPPVNWLRNMNGPADVVFTICRPGWSFQLPENSWGRLMPVCQSTVEENVETYSTCRRPPGTVESGMSNSWRWLLVASFAVTLLSQFQRPMRSGVWKDMVVCRRWGNSASESSFPISPTMGK